MSDPWDDHAAWWQEEFTDGADPEYEEQILPLAAELLSGSTTVLEVGAGEGQVARRLSDAGVPCVVGLEPSSAQVGELASRAGGVVGLQASATALPVSDRSVDGVLVCLVLEHVADLDAALDELARVGSPGGRLVVMLNHPFIQAPGSAWIEDHTVDPPERYWRLMGYLAEQVLDDEVDAGVVIRFHHRPLSRYLQGLVDRGLRLERMLEPAPPTGFLERAPEYDEAADIPRLLVLAFRYGGA